MPHGPVTNDMHRLMTVTDIGLMEVIYSASFVYFSTLEYSDKLSG